MIGRLRWSNQNSPPKGGSSTRSRWAPCGPDAAMGIANAGASPTRDTTYPSLAPKTLHMDFGNARNYGLDQREENDNETRSNSASDLCAKRKSLLHLPENGVQIAT